MGRLTFVRDLWLYGLCTGIPVIDPEFDLDISQFFLIPPFSFNLC